mmetsp:Transcript_19463/g.61734  ORF Transcript_19463/g.61734 Transcript_19463/m.61734 type:complete len:402 (-) Transcript_19463:1426-2631(-)
MTQAARARKDQRPHGKSQSQRWPRVTAPAAKKSTAWSDTRPSTTGERSARRTSWVPPRSQAMTAVAIVQSPVCSRPSTTSAAARDTTIALYNDVVLHAPCGAPAPPEGEEAAVRERSNTCTEVSSKVLRSRVCAASPSASARAKVAGPRGGGEGGEARAELGPPLPCASPRVARPAAPLAVSPRPLPCAGSGSGWRCPLLPRPLRLCGAAVPRAAPLRESAAAVDAPTGSVPFCAPRNMSGRTGASTCSRLPKPPGPSSVCSGAVSTCARSQTRAMARWTRSRRLSARDDLAFWRRHATERSHQAMPVAFSAPYRASAGSWESTSPSITSMRRASQCSASTTTPRQASASHTFAHPHEGGGGTAPLPCALRAARARSGGMGRPPRAPLAQCTSPVVRPVAM